MKKNIFYGVSAAALMFAFVSCGGGEETTDETTDSTETTEDVIEPIEYTIDTESSVINWYTMNGEEKGHFGTTMVMEGTYTTEGDLITSASLTADLNTFTVEDEMGGEKLQGHIMSPDLLDVNQYATAVFTFDRHEDGIVYGSLSVAGNDMAIEAPATVGEGTIDIADFNVDMGALNFYVTERAEAAEDEWHDTNIGFTASIVAQ